MIQQILELMMEMMDLQLIMQVILMVQVIEISVQQLLEDLYHFPFGHNLSNLDNGKEYLILELEQDKIMF